MSFQASLPYLLSAAQAAQKFREQSLPKIKLLSAAQAAQKKAPIATAHSVMLSAAQAAQKCIT